MTTAEPKVEPKVEPKAKAVTVKVATPAPKPNPSPPLITNGAINPKIAIAAEMMAIWITTILLFHQRHPKVSWVDLFIFIGVPSGVALVILLGLLTLPVDISGAEWPVWFGAIIAASSILYQGTAASKGLDALLNQLVEFTQNATPLNPVPVVP